MGDNPLVIFLVIHITVGGDPAGLRSTTDQNDLTPKLTEPVLNDRGIGEGGGPLVLGDAVSIDGALDVFVCRTGASKATPCVEIAANDCGIDVEHRCWKTIDFFESEARSW